MPRTARASAGNIIYHVINRGNGRATIFHKPQDFEAFLVLIALACERIPMRVLAICLMPNHIHLVLWPYKDGDLSRWMQWLMTSHVRRYHKHYGSNGHVWAGRFKAFPVQDDEHLLIVVRYVERNARRANLVKRAEDWQWSSLHLRRLGRTPWLHNVPVTLPRNWVSIVNEPQTDAELAELRASIARGRPFGEERWQRATAARLGLQSALRPRGRPKQRPAPLER